MLIPPVVLLDSFVAMVMFSIGLRVRGGDLFAVLGDRRLLVRTLLVNCLVIPAIGFVLVRIFPLTPDARIGILLLAAIPGTPIALQFTRRAMTRLAFAASMTFVLSVVSLAMVPLAIEIMPEIAEHDERPLILLVTNIVFYIALPLVLGLWAGRSMPRVAGKLALPLGILASLTFVFLMWETRLVRREAFQTIRGGGSVAAMAILLLLSMAIGWMIGGPDSESRRVVATATSMRSVVVVLYVARYCFPATMVYMVPIVYLSLMVPTNMVFHLAYTGWHKWRSAAT